MSRPRVVRGAAQIDLRWIAVAPPVGRRELATKVAARTNFRALISGRRAPYSGARLMRRAFVRALLIAAFTLLVVPRADAVPIGTFSWQGSCAPPETPSGPCFAVENFSDLFLPSIGLDGQSFLNIVIHLAADTPVDIATAPVFDDDPAGLLAAGFSIQTTDDLTPLAIHLATLTFDFALKGTVVLLDGETGNPIEGLVAADTLATIDFTPVPEPGSLLLVGAGLAMYAWLGRRAAA